MQQQRKGKETSIPLQKDSESQSKRQSLTGKLLEYCRKGDTRRGERLEKEGRIEELVGDQNPGLEAPPRCKTGRERREQRKCHGRSDRQMSNGEV